MFELVKMKVPEKGLKMMKKDLSFVKVVNMYQKLLEFSKL
jgi:hypothetical protein